MVFEPNYTRVVSSIREKVGVMQTEVDVKLSAEEESISSVLSVGATATHFASSSNGKDVNISGLLDVKVLYEANGAPYVLDYIADFKEKYIANELVQGELILTGNVVDITYSVSGRDIRIKATIEIEIDEIKNKEYNVLTSINNANVFTKTNVETYQTYEGIAQDKFEEIFEFEIKDAISILSVQPTAKLIGVTTSDKFLTITGKVYMDVCYKTGDTLKDISTQNFEFDFTQEIANDGIKKGSFIQSILDVVTNEMKVDYNIVEGKLKVGINLPLLYRGYIFNEYEINAILDIYSATHYLGVTYDNVQTMQKQSVTLFTDKVSGMVSISESLPFIDEVVGACINNVVLTKSEVRDYRLVVEGVISVSGVYYSKENERLNSVAIDIPFVLEEMVQYESNANTKTTLTIENITTRSRRGKEIEVNVDINVYTELYEIAEDNFITDVIMGEEIIRDNCALTIYVVREGDTVWSIAKDMGVSPDLIYAQNDIEGELSIGDKLVIYAPSSVYVS